MNVVHEIPATEGTDLRLSGRGAQLRAALIDFMNELVFPAEAEYHAYRAANGPADHTLPPVVEKLKSEARSRGLSNLFLPAVSGIGQLDYAFLAEITGWSLELAPEGTNDESPTPAHMELLHLFGTEEQKARWLEPLLEARIRLAFAMTEPAVASSDATNIETQIVRDGTDYVIDGRKWWTSGAADPRCPRRFRRSHAWTGPAGRCCRLFFACEMRPSWPLPC